MFDSSEFPDDPIPFQHYIKTEEELINPYGKIIMYTFVHLM